MRSAELMPSPSRFGWPLTSVTTLSGPRLIPEPKVLRPQQGHRARPSISWRSRRARPSAYSGLTRNPTAAPSPVSRTTRLLPRIGRHQALQQAGERLLGGELGGTDFFEKPTRSAKTTAAMRVWRSIEGMAGSLSRIRARIAPFEPGGGPEFAVSVPGRSRDKWGALDRCSRRAWSLGASSRPYRANARRCGYRV